MALVRYRAGSTTLSVTGKPEGGAAMKQHNPVLSGRRLKNNRNRNSTGREFTEGKWNRGRARACSLRRRAYFGGLNSPASQPRMSDFMGSLATTVVRTQPHFWHS